MYCDTYYIIENCSKDDKALESFIIYSLLVLSIYLFMNGEKKIGDCDYNYFSKMILFISIILSIAYNLTELLLISLLLLIRFYYG